MFRRSCLNWTVWTHLKSLITEKFMKRGRLYSQLCGKATEGEGYIYISEIFWKLQRGDSRITNV